MNAGLESQTDGALFGAFLSYSHADRALAERFHRKLEHYRLPKRLRGDLTSIRNNGSLGPIFRDREDLPAAEDLTASVKQALAASQALIVLCSPNAQKSPWVAREITLFRELHPDRPVLAAILHGEPSEVFPPPLRDGLEPIAADFRKEGDGPKLGLLKVVAGIAGVPLDALIQRDAQRQLRSVMAVTGLAAMVSVIMAIMTSIAIQARNDAQFQRFEAEGLVDYLLTDLRADLKSVGRLDVMEDVNERAMKYYEAQDDLTELQADSLERRARILHLMGDDDLQRSNRQQALGKFLEAYRVTEALLEKDPRNPDRVFAHGQSAFWIGAVFYDLKDTANTRTYWEKYRDLSLLLNQLQPNSVRSIREIGYAEGNLCALALDEPVQPNSALEKCGLALKEMEKVNTLVPEDPKIGEDLANRYAWFADALKANDRSPEALNFRHQQIKLLKLLSSRDPQSFHLKELLMKANYAAAATAYEACLPEEGQAFETVFRGIVRELVSHDPSNSTWKKFGSANAMSDDKKRSCKND